MPLRAKRMFEMQRCRAFWWKYRAVLQRYRTLFSLTSNVKVSRHFGQEECLLRAVRLSFPPMATCTYSVGTYSVGIQMLLPLFWARAGFGYSGSTFVLSYYHLHIHCENWNIDTCILGKYTIWWKWFCCLCLLFAPVYTVWALKGWYIYTYVDAYTHSVSICCGDTYIYIYIYICWYEYRLYVSYIVIYMYMLMHVYTMNVWF